MSSTHQKLYPIEDNIGISIKAMSGRTPSFIVVGLVIIMFLLGLFYMSCSSKNSELRLSLEQYEERIRSLTIKNSDLDKKLENTISRKHELEEDKLNIQRQMEKKDSEINDLNTKLNEKLSEIQSLKSDKTAFEQQVKDYKSVSDSAASKDALIEQLRQQLNEEKQSKTDELNRLQQQIESLKNSQPSQSIQVVSNNTPSSSFIIPQQRFQPWTFNDTTTRSISSLFLDPLNKLNNQTKEVKPNAIQSVLEIPDKFAHAIDINTTSSTTTISNGQQQLDNDADAQLRVGRNLPVPPFAEVAQKQTEHVESVQAAPSVADKVNQDNQEVVDNDHRHRERLQRSLTNPAVENKDEKQANDANNENDDEALIAAQNEQQNAVVSVNENKQDVVENDKPAMEEHAKVQPDDNNNYRIGNRRRFRSLQNQIHEEEKLNKEIDNENKNNVQE